MPLKSFQNWYKLRLYVLILLPIAICSACGFTPYLKKSNGDSDARDVPINKVCISMPVNSNHARIIYNSLANLLDPRKIDKSISECDYLIKINHSAFTSYLGDISGAIMQNTSRMTASYALFKINKQKVNNLTDILETPTSVKFESISNKFSGISTHKARPEYSQIIAEKAYAEAYSEDIAKIKEHHKALVEGNTITVTSHNSNALLLSAEYQQKIDAYESMASNIANDLFNKIIIAFYDEKEGRLTSPDIILDNEIPQ